MAAAGGHWLIYMSTAWTPSSEGGSRRAIQIPRASDLSLLALMVVHLVHPVVTSTCKMSRNSNTNQNKSGYLYLPMGESRRNPASNFNNRMICVFLRGQFENRSSNLNSQVPMLRSLTTDLPTMRLFIRLSQGQVPSPRF